MVEKSCPSLFKPLAPNSGFFAFSIKNEFENFSNSLFYDKFAFFFKKADISATAKERAASFGLILG